MFQFYSNSNYNIIGQTIYNLKKNTDRENGIQKKARQQWNQQEVELELNDLKIKISTDTT